ADPRRAASAAVDAAQAGLRRRPRPAAEARGARDGRREHLAAVDARPRRRRARDAVLSHDGARASRTRPARQRRACRRIASGPGRRRLPPARSLRGRPDARGAAARARGADRHASAHGARATPAGRRVPAAQAADRAPRPRAAVGALRPVRAAPADTLGRTALERRPPVDAFPPRRRPIERLARELLGSRCGRPLDAALVPSAPSGSLALAKRIAAELAAAAGTDRSRAEPLLKDWWTGALRTPSISDEPVKLPGESSEPDDVDRAPSAARLRRSPARREAIDGEDDEDDAGLVAVQQDDPHPHAEDPMGLRRPVDRDEDASAEQLGDMVSDLPEARTIATPAPPKEVLLSDDPPDARAELEPNLDAARAPCIRYPEWDYRTNTYRLPGAGVRPSVAPPGPEEWVDATL